MRKANKSYPLLEAFGTQLMILHGLRVKKVGKFFMILVICESKNKTKTFWDF